MPAGPGNWESPRKVRSSCDGSSTHLSCYTDGDPCNGGTDKDVTVQSTYNPDGNILTLTAKNSTTGDQVTSYVYGTAMGGITPEIYRNDLLRAEIYPDSDDTTTLAGDVFPSKWP